MKFLDGKKIFFYGPITYNYHTKIIEQIRIAGGTVQFFGESNLDLGYRISKNISKGLFERYKTNLFSKVIESLTADDFDYVLVIYASTLNADKISIMRNCQPKAIFIMYQWDSLYLFNYSSMINSFDTVFSFDRFDCENDSRLQYLPLFYDHDKILTGNDHESKYDLLFIGTLHSDRYQILDNIAKQAYKLNLKFYFYLYVPVFRYIKHQIILGKNILLKYIHFHSIDEIKLNKLMKSSRIIIDINNIGQHGLTMRTFETLGLGKKLITTNSYIYKEPFYNPKSINIIDRNNPILEKQFIENDDIHALNIDKYKIDSWLRFLFNENIATY